MSMKVFSSFMYFDEIECKICDYGKLEFKSNMMEFELYDREMRDTADHGNLVMYH